MGTFNTKTTLNADPALIPAIAERICYVFSQDGYEVVRENFLSGSVDISVTKGGFFRSILGLKTALKISLTAINDSAIDFEAGVGIFGQQAIPTVISMLFFWPVIITQIWGLIQQSDLDDKALEAARAVINEHTLSHSSAYGSATPPPPPFRAKFCTHCGSQLLDDARFCSYCGASQN